MIYLILVCILIQVAHICITLLMVRRRIKSRESEYYTDYVHGNLVMRVFKVEFEFQAVGNINANRILDRGTLSPTYLWALIEL